MTIAASLLLILSGVGASDVPLPSDLNRDCAINFADVLAMAEQWLSESSAVNLGGSGRVDMVDFAAISADWGRTSGCDCNECEDRERSSSVTSTIS